ncbi:alpha/beta fold hydrolase [Streptomyces sp. NBC_01275]|uniref:thioesterase II family protein n=1 Tax=Streptomyces sp. NBC_01275 TaxID=2903807 RepID=UPI002251AE82|nr:alpha/beta fold hydrolase [Streptomyces sp. NBC_01275]MCX4766718.1 alpha/beta fold hydrolase [Streptomyces sp. NBC_01275]
MDVPTAPPQRPGAWLRRYGAEPAEAEATLVCLPHAGGAPTFFRDWPELMSPEVDVLAVCYPGRQDRFHELPVTGMAEMAAAVATALVPLADRPLALFGHSMGAAVGYEAARLLRARHGIALSHLFVSAMVPPHRLRRRSRHLLSDAELAAELLAQGGTDTEVLADDELRAMVMPAVRADYRLIETYRHDAGAEPLDTPVVAYHGRQDPAVTEAAVQEWRRYTRGTAEARSFPGGHFYLREARRTLTTDLRERLLASVRPLTRPTGAARGRAACTANAPR